MLLMADFRDDDFIYVDPEKRVVVGRVEWTAEGLPIPLKRGEEDVQQDTAEHAHKERRRTRERYYPWGSYRTMKQIYRLEGKTKEAAGEGTLDTVLEKALREPYWD